MSQDVPASGERGDAGSDVRSGARADAPRRAVWSTPLAMLLFACALATPFAEVWREDPSVVVPMFPRFEN